MCFLIFYYFQITPTCSLIAGLCLLAVTDCIVNTSVVFTAIRKSEQESQSLSQRECQSMDTQVNFFFFFFNSLNFLETVKNKVIMTLL